MPIPTIYVRHLEAEEFIVRVGDHALMVDQPVAAGGFDLGPTPTELFIAALTSSAAVNAGHYLNRRGLPVSGLRVSAEFAVSQDPPPRVASVTIRVYPPYDFPGEDIAELRAEAENGAVHNSLLKVPELSVEVATAQQVA